MLPHFRCYHTISDNSTLCSSSSSAAPPHTRTNTQVPYEIDKNSRFYPNKVFAQIALAHLLAFIVICNIQYIPCNGIVGVASVINRRGLAVGF